MSEAGRDPGPQSDRDALWDLFDQALELPLAARSDFLDRQNLAPEMRQELDRLLVAHEADHSLLDDRDVAEELGVDLAVDAALTESVSADASERVGELIDRYRLTSVLGEGGMGVVYGARQTDPIERNVAIKILRHGAISTEALQRFTAERQSLALMNHPHIAKIHDVGTTDGGAPWFAMEQVEGEPLLAACDRRGLGLNDRLRLMISVCLAIQHAHQRGVIHRDLKPSNILVSQVDDAPTAKVIDFGIARVVTPEGTQEHDLTGYGVVGTPAYMSPEQFDPEGVVDTRTDLYSLGVVLYELITGQVPTRASGALTPDRRTQPPSRVLRSDTGKTTGRHSGTGAALSRKVSGDLDAIILQCLEHDPDLRYASAAALADDLSRFLDGLPVQAAGAALNYRVRKFITRHWLAVGSAATILVLLIALTVNTQVQSARVRRALAESQAQTQRAERVTDFLTEVFRSADPDQVQGEQVTMRDVLDRGAARIGEELAEEPLTQADSSWRWPRSTAISAPSTRRSVWPAKAGGRAERSWAKTTPTPSRRAATSRSG